MKERKNMTKAELVEEIERIETTKTNALGLDRDLTIVERLVQIGREVGPMDKTEMKNVGYSAFAIDNVYSKLRPLFSKWEVVIIPRLRPVKLDYVPRHEKSPALDAHVLVDYEFHSPDGSSATMTFGADGRDYGDKSTNKAVQQAFKYGLIQMFMISTGEVDPDAIEVDEETPHETPRKQSPRKQAPVEDAKANLEELLLKQVKDHAWILTADIEPESYRIEETKLLIESEIESYGGVPKDATDAQAIMANMDGTMEVDEDDGTGYGG